MYVIGKTWGETRPILVTPLIELHHVIAGPGGYCSKHKHLHKWNGFWVIRGWLEIDVWPDEYELIDKTMVGPGDFTTVAPGLFHQFRNPTATKDCEFLEIYYLHPLSRDIIRETVGGGQYARTKTYPDRTAPNNGDAGQSWESDPRTPNQEPAES